MATMWLISTCSSSAERATSSSTSSSGSPQACANTTRSPDLTHFIASAADTRLRSYSDFQSIPLLLELARDRGCQLRLGRGDAVDELAGDDDRDVAVPGARRGFGGRRFAGRARRRVLRAGELVVRGAGPGTAAEVHRGSGTYVRVVERQAGGDGGAVDVRVTATAVDDLHAPQRFRRLPLGHRQSAESAVGALI